MNATGKISLFVLLRIQGFLLLIEGFFMLTLLPVTYFHHGINAFSMPFSALITVLTGFILCIATKKVKGQKINHREGVITICISWLVMSVFGGLPFLLSKSVPNFTDAFFEALSGFTTTGATILTQIEAVPKDILLTGFDDVKYASLVSPPLTTFRQPCADIARAAFEALLARSAEPDRTPRTILLNAPLVARDSTSSRK